MAILTTVELMDKFLIGSQTTILQLFRSKDSPAFKIGKNWRCDDDKFEKFLLKQSEQYKG